MNIPNPTPATQHLHVVTPAASAGFNAADALLVNQQQLAAVHAEVRGVSRCLHSLENPAALDWEEWRGLCRALSRAAGQLAEMLDGQTH